MKTISQTSKEYFNQLTVLHTALFCGQLLFGGFAIYFGSKGAFSRADENFTYLLKIAVPVFMAGAIGAKVFLVKPRLRSLRQIPVLRKKLGDYRGVILTKLALIQGPYIFALLCFLLTSDYVFAALAGLMFILFLFAKPTQEKTIAELQLGRNEMDLLENPDAIVADIIVRKN